MNTPSPHDPRALAHRLTTIGHALHHRLFAQLRAGGIHPKTVLLLSAVDGRIDAPEVLERLARGGKRVDALEAQRLIARTDDGWRLTDEGRSVLDRVDAERSALLDGIPAETLAALAETLDLLAEKLDVGDDDHRGPFGRGVGPGPRGGFGPRRGFGSRGDGGLAFGPNLHHGFRSGQRPGPVQHARPGDGGAEGDEREPGAEAPHCGRGTDHRRHGFGPRHGHHRAERFVQRAYERGFDAGFSRGRASTASV